MFVMTAQEWVDKFTEDMKSGWLKPDDVIGVEYWTYDDVRYFTEGDSYYDELTDGEGVLSDDVARTVFGKVADGLRRYDNVDNDMVRDQVSYVLDEMIGGK